MLIALVGASRHEEMAEEISERLKEDGHNVVNLAPGQVPDVLLVVNVGHVNGNSSISEQTRILVDNARAIALPVFYASDMCWNAQCDFRLARPARRCVLCGE